MFRSVLRKISCLKASKKKLRFIKLINFYGSTRSLVHVGMFSFHVDAMRAPASSSSQSADLLAEVTARRLWRLAASFRTSSGLQTDFKRSGWTSEELLLKRLSSDAEQSEAASHRCMSASGFSAFWGYFCPRFQGGHPVELAVASRLSANGGLRCGSYRSKRREAAFFPLFLPNNGCLSLP